MVAGFVLFVAGAGFLWLGLKIAFEPSRDTSTNVALAFGALFGLIVLVLLGAAVGLMIQTLEYVVPRWLAALPVLLGVVPYPALMGPGTIVLNLLLLATAALLQWSRRIGPRTLNGPSDRARLE